MLDFKEDKRICIECGGKIDNSVFTICSQCFVFEREDLKILEELNGKEKNNLIKLNLGCFNRKIHGFINVDIRSGVDPDIVDDIQVLKKFINESVHLIYACHCLEHLTYKNARNALLRWWQVLKFGGTLRISVPDIRQHCAAYFYFNDLNRLKSGFYGSQNHSFDNHLSGWDYSMIEKELKFCGFRNIKKYNFRETEHAFVDDYSMAMIPHMDKENGIQMSLNVEAIK